MHISRLWSAEEKPRPDRGATVSLGAPFLHNPGVEAPRHTRGLFEPGAHERPLSQKARRLKIAFS